MTMNRQTAQQIIEALQNSTAVERIAIKDNSVDSKAYFTLEQYADESNELTADYVCFYLKIDESDKANVKQTRFHFESAKRIVLNVQYREIVASDSAFTVKKSSIDYKCTADYASAIQRVLNVHTAYVTAQRERAQRAEQTAQNKRTAKQTAEQSTAKQNSAKQTAKQAQNSTAKRTAIKSEAKHSKATVKRRAQQKAQ